MKRSFIVSLVLFIVHSGIAQNYFPFPTDSARWRVGYHMSVFGCTSLVTEYQYEITGDTTISNTVYHKISEVGYTNNASCYSPYQGYVGCMREDTNKHVYFRFNAATADSLLYDFNLNVGDTVKTWQDCCHDAVVTSIDSILIGTSYRKQFHVTAGFWCGMATQSIIEGIGSTGGLLECFGWYEAGSSLICFWQNGQTLYPNTTVSCDEMVAGVPTNSVNNNLSAFPVPSSGEIFISSPMGFYSPQQIFISDLNGRIIRSENIQPADRKLIIERKNLDAGFYFIEITNSAGITGRVKIFFL